MKPFLIAYFAFLVLFIVIDFIWLSKAGDAFYRPAMGNMVLPGFRLAPAFVFYALYTLGVVALAILPGLAAGGWHGAGIRGCLFGLCAYATYDLTNQATLKHWSTTLSIVDMSWGALLTGFSAACAAALVSKLA